MRVDELGGPDTVTRRQGRITFLFVESASPHCRSWPHVLKIAVIPPSRRPGAARRRSRWPRARRSLSGRAEAARRWRRIGHGPRAVAAGPPRRAGLAFRPHHRGADPRKRQGPFPVQNGRREPLISCLAAGTGPVPWPERRPLPDPTARGRRTTSPASTPTLVGTTDPRLWLGATTPRGLCAPLLIACRSTPAQSASRGKPLHRLGRCSLALCRRTTWTASDRGSSGSGNSVFVIVLALKHKC